MLSSQPSENKEIKQADIVSKINGVGTTLFAVMAHSMFFKDTLDTFWESSEEDTATLWTKWGIAAALSVVTGLLVGALHLDNSRVNQSANIRSISDEELAQIKLPLKYKLSLGIHGLADALEGVGTAIGVLSKMGIEKQPCLWGLTTWGVFGKITGLGIGAAKAIGETRNMLTACQRLVHESHFAASLQEELLTEDDIELGQLKTSNGK